METQLTAERRNDHGKGVARKLRAAGRVPAVLYGHGQETQALSKWYWLPLQVVSCTVGNSHAVHHFFVAQPFYLRELVRRDAHTIMRNHGVRFDDVGSFTRANRWGSLDSVPVCS